jgi:hypothetical protein
MNDPRETNPPTDAPAPDPKAQEPSVYGGTWGDAGKQGDLSSPTAPVDRPGKIQTPPEKE